MHGRRRFGKLGRRLRALMIDLEAPSRLTSDTLYSIEDPRRLSRRPHGLGGTRRCVSLGDAFRVTRCPPKSVIGTTNR